ncbi:unnamed protein product [Candidula unifasciata]|uniref:Uncharacterized protein n=1 Tax=Candidula unifasciata TaxID=100452 RepID=A0A8S3Z4T3_9EUPU|nr:unnamed protein product [Candidula unifasciata]
MRQNLVRQFYKMANNVVKVATVVKVSRLRRLGQYFGAIANDYKAVAKDIVQDVRSGSVKASVYITGLVATGILFKSNPSARDLDDAVIESAHELSLIGAAIRSKEADNYVDSLRSAQRDGLLHHTNVGLFSLVWLSDNRDELDLYEAQCSYVHMPWYQWYKRVIDVGVLGKFVKLSRKMKDYDINEEAWETSNKAT